MKLKPAEGCRVLVLAPAVDAGILALDAERELSDLVGVQVERAGGAASAPTSATTIAERRAQPGARRGVVVEADAHAAVQTEVAAEAVDDGLGEIELPVVDERLIERVANGDVVVHALDLDPVATGDERRVGVAVDRRREHRPAAFVAVGRHVCAAASETDAEGRPRTNRTGSEPMHCGRGHDASSTSALPAASRSSTTPIVGASA